MKSPVVLTSQKPHESIPVPGFFDGNVIIHTHIEKTAGSTLTRGFVRAFGKDRVHDLRSPREARLDKMAASDRSHIYFLTGHFHFGTQDKYFDRSKLYVASVRPPLDRFRSYYDFVRVRPPHPGYPALAGKSFAEAIEQHLSVPRRANAMARTLTGSTEPSQSAVCAQAEKKYLIVTPHHRVNDTLRKLIPLLGGRVRRKELYINRSEERTAVEIGDLADVFNRTNSLDNALYQFVEARYDCWLSELESRLVQRSTKVER